MSTGSAVETAALVGRRQISSIEVVDDALARIGRLNPQLNAFVHVDAHRARAAARDAEQGLMRGEAPGPLHGVPMSVKSSIDVAGLRCECGTRLRAGHVASSDAPLVARLRRAGATEEFRPAELEAARRAWWTNFVRLGSALLAELTAGHEVESHPILRELIALGQEEPPLTAMDVTDAWVQRDELRARLLAHMRRCPILICPVAAIPAFRHGEREWRVDGATVRYLAREGPNAWAYTQWFNLLGNPAASVPVGRTAGGLPVGVQVVGRPWEEHVVLAVAREIERACGGFVPPAIA